MTDPVCAHAGGAFKSPQEHHLRETWQKKKPAVFAESAGGRLTLTELPTLTPTNAEAGVRVVNKAAIVASAVAMVTSNRCSLPKRYTYWYTQIAMLLLLYSLFPFKKRSTCRRNSSKSAGRHVHVALLFVSFAGVLRSTFRRNPATDGD